MTENRGIWIDLAPRIVDRAILQLKEIKSVNNVQFKCLNISCCENVEAIFTVCYRVSLRLDVDGSERTLAIFVKVNSIFGKSMVQSTKIGMFKNSLNDILVGFS